MNTTLRDAIRYAADAIEAHREVVETAVAADRADLWSSAAMCRLKGLDTLADERKVGGDRADATHRALRSRDVTPEALVAAHWPAILAAVVRGEASLLVVVAPTRAARANTEALGRVKELVTRVGDAHHDRWLDRLHATLAEIRRAHPHDTEREEWEIAAWSDDDLGDLYDPTADGGTHPDVVAGIYRRARDEFFTQRAVDDFGACA
ncbi:hypothetical protein [Streptomyces exfoliatus]|uniref:hypothetical protein n=1 Tax=Streptomyces exfoliatus TaxID=1905 RepID=UPI00379A7929